MQAKLGARVERKEPRAAEATEVARRIDRLAQMGEDFPDRFPPRR